MNETFAPFFEAAHTIMSDTHVITLLAVAVTVAATLGALIRKLLLENGTEKKAVEQVARLETAITQLIDAEKFGHVGSFAWNFDDPTLSFWSEEMYRLFGI